ncbi:hypothetical protein [Mesorhizobium captivum]|uniref:hypothetical protein n=1 Tax=Mesorhizobium captivum TaxID=3072319 RepID=UPI002A23D535|nr:hypothetical protein [Mesorhizobium sp. VK23E]MDX8515017.1 hypothetical protein [Mesorhizobium sp. VK23E]
MNRKVASIGWMRRPVWANDARGKVQAAARPPIRSRKARREKDNEGGRFMITRFEQFQRRIVQIGHGDFSRLMHVAQKCVAVLRNDMHKNKDLKRVA